MNLHHAITFEKMILSHINGIITEDCFEIDLDTKEYIFSTKNLNECNLISYTFDGLEELIVAPSGPGFFLITEKNSSEQLIVELKQSIPTTIR